MPPILHIHLLGDFHLSFGDKTVTGVNTTRLRSLLAYLVLHRNSPQHRQGLAFLFWPDSTEAQAHNNLRQSIHRLRLALPDAEYFLHSDEQTVQWLPDSPFTLDVAEFEKAVAQVDSSASLQYAANLYQGELLPGCYDDWILPERERLQQRFIETLERLILLCENQHEYRSSIQYAERLLRTDPLREETYQQLMRLHTLSGNRTGALRVYKTCVTVLKRELDVEPSSETQAVYEASQNIEVSSVRPRPSLQPRTNNLPTYLTSFIGRKVELESLTRLFTSRDASTSQTRLITLTGAGGCGKTRLAIELATQLLETFPDGVWFVDLAPMTNPMLIPQAIASVLGVQDQSGRMPLDILSSYLQTRQILLILDNCEHLVAVCAQVVQSLLHASPRLRVLVTSREKLYVMGETAWPVRSLSLPDINDQTPAQASRSDAVHLFVERACSVLPTFTLNTDNTASVIRICQHLDGIPLAIELAAARIPILTPGQIAARLNNAFQLLRRSGYTTRPHHQTLRATMDWSYELLSEQERTLFLRLAIFAGGFTLEAVEQVCADPAEQGNVPHAEILDLLSRLIDKSLVMALEWKPDQIRYRLLEPIWQYANQKLLEAGDLEQLGSRHLEFFLELAEEAEPKLKGETQGIWLERLELEHDNLRAALWWSMKEEGNAVLGLRLASALVDFWIVRGEFTEGRHWLEVALKQSNDTQAPWRAKALLGAGELAFFHGDLAASRSLLEDSLVTFRELGIKPGIAYSLFRLGVTATLFCDLAAARSFFEESLGLFRELGQQQGIAYVLYGQGHLADTQGEWSAARVLLEESLTIFRELGDKQGIVLALQDLGMGIAELGDCTLGRSILEESMAIARELGSRLDVSRTAWALGKVAYREGNYALARSWYAEFATIVKAIGTRLGMLYLLTACARLAASEGQFERMTQLLGAAEHLSNTMGAPIVPVERIEHERLATISRHELGEDVFVKAWAKGRAMKLEQAIEYALKAENS